MGHYRVTLVAVGAHGCQREMGTGDAVVGCDRPNCPDCITREYVRRLKRAGEQVQLAQIEHWPADLGYPESSLVLDDLLGGKRKGDFPEKDRYQRQATVPVRILLHGPDGGVKVVPISVLGAASVESIINLALGERYGQPGRRVRAYLDPAGLKHYFGPPPEGKSGISTPGAYPSGGSDYDLTFGDGIAWRLGKPSCFTLQMEARHLPKNEPERVAVYPNEFMLNVEALPEAAAAPSPDPK